MEAKELRIGNYVDFEYGEENRTFGFLTTIEDANDLLGIENGNLKAQPIPLTEDWLLKFGFEKTKENFCTYDLGKISIYMPGIYYEEGRTYFNNWVIIEKSPKSVHQLQNLYFALTGEELKLKNPTD